MQTPTKWVELVKGRVRWHVRLMDRNGKIILTSQTYYSKSNANRAARRLATALNLSVLPVKGK